MADDASDSPPRAAAISLPRAAAGASGGADPGERGQRALARQSARVIVAGPGDVLLLMRFSGDAGGSGAGYWLTPGGGVRADESLAGAAARELAEETGITAAASLLGPPVARSCGQWRSGQVVYDACDSFFFLRVPDLAVDTRGQEDLERSLCTGYQWWPLADLAASGEIVYPPGLPEFAGRLLAGDRPAEPVRLPWR